MKKYHKTLILIISITLLVVIVFISSKIYSVYVFNELEEYSSYTTQDEKYTISLKNDSEAGLIGAMRLSVYLVHNDNGYIEYIGKKRLDYYNDFTPYVKYTESNNKVVVTFYAKFSISELSINIG